MYRFIWKITLLNIPLQREVGRRDTMGVLCGRVLFNVYTHTHRREKTEMGEDFRWMHV